MSKPVSLNDLARELGVSVTSVSLVLNGKDGQQRISAALAATIRAHAQERGYKPNLMAKGLRTGISKTIGLFLEDISNPFYASLARHVEELALSEGYKIIFCSTANDAQRTLELLRLFQGRHVDGYLMAPPEGVEEALQTLMDSAHPLVLIDRYLPGLAADSVVVNNLESAAQATAHLLQAGYDRIGFVGTASQQTQMQDRRQGYAQAMEAAGLPTTMASIQNTLGKGVIYEQVKAFVQAHPQLNALLFATNYLAVQGLKVLKELQLAVPRDRAVVSFGDNESLEIHSPPVTAVAQPLQALAQAATNRLLARLRGTEMAEPTARIVLPCQLIVRASTQRLG